MAYELLEEIFAGYPRKEVRKLIQSRNAKALRAAAWIISELGDDIGTLTDQLADLLANHDRYVRFFTLDAVLLNGAPHDAELLAAAVALIEDPDSAVRWKAAGFLSRVSPEQLLAASSRIPAGDRLRSSIAWLADVAPSPEEADLERIREGLAAADRRDRLVSAAAAARVAGASPETLELARDSPDPEVADFASRWD